MGAVELGTGSERKRGVEGDSIVFGLSNRKSGATRREDGQGFKWIKSSSFPKLEVAFTQPSTDVG